jgi:hypothetical protein
MLRFLVLSLVCIFASDLTAAEPNDGVAREITELKRELAELSRRVNVIEQSLNKPAEDTIAIRFDRLRIPYCDATLRDSAGAEIVEKAHKTYFGGTFSRDIGWEQISVENASEIESLDLRSTVSRIPVGRMSEILDDGSAFYVLRVTSRSK